MNDEFTLRMNAFLQLFEMVADEMAEILRSKAEAERLGVAEEWALFQKRID